MLYKFYLRKRKQIGTQVELHAGRTRSVNSRLRQSKRQYTANLRPETGRILPVWYRQYYGRIVPCSIRPDTTVVNGETCKRVTTVLQHDTVALQRSQPKMTTFTTVLSRERSSKIKRQNNHRIKSSLKRPLEAFQRPIGSSLKRLFKAFQRLFYTNRTFPKKVFQGISKAFLNQ